MDIGYGLHQIRENANRGLYQNLRYQTERISKKNIIIDTNKINRSPTTFTEHKSTRDEFSPPTSNQTNFRTSLVTPLKIDTTSEVYIDSIYFIGDNNTDKYDNIIGYPITLNIQLLGNSCSSNNDAIDGNMLIVVDELKSNSVTQKSVSIIKNKKLNYISTINPMNIKDIEFTLKLSDGKSIFSDDQGNGNGLRVIFEIVIVSKE